MKLHLGCGKRFIPGFTHVDLGDFPHIDHRHDIRSLPFVNDGAAELIYCCHAFEYFDRDEAVHALSEWRRVLQPGGVLRLAVPDFAALADLYREGLPLERVLGPMYGKMSTAGGTIYHRTIYDFPTLSALLTSSGFAQPRLYDWRETIHKDYDDFSQAYFPHMDKEKGRLISLNVECTRP